MHLPWRKKPKDIDIFVYSRCSDNTGLVFSFSHFLCHNVWLSDLLLLRSRFPVIKNPFYLGMTKLWYTQVNIHLWLNGWSQRGEKVTEVCFQLRNRKHFPYASSDSICAHLINKTKMWWNFTKDEDKALKGNDAFQLGGTAASAPPDLCVVFRLCSYGF